MPRSRASCLRARRLVAEHCLYGVDINPLAVEMAKLSLWLVTMDRERPFGFLDDRLVCGDSLLGITSMASARDAAPRPSRAASGCIATPSTSAPAGGRCSRARRTPVGVSPRRRSSPCATSSTRPGCFADAAAAAAPLVAGRRRAHRRRTEGGQAVGSRQRDMSSDALYDAVWTYERRRHTQGPRGVCGSRYNAGLPDWQRGAPAPALAA